MTPVPIRLSFVAALCLPSLAACTPTAPAAPPVNVPPASGPATPREAPLPTSTEVEDPDVAALRSEERRADARERLSKRMTVAEPVADAAALQLTRLLEDESDPVRTAARELLRMRLEAKVGGAYLGPLSKVLRDDLAPPEEGAADRQPGKAVYDALAYLVLVPRDEATRNELTQWARRNARVVPRARAPGAHFAAWHALLTLGVLHDGMTVPEAAAILGTPTARTAADIEWYAESRMHVNPSLRAKLRDDSLWTIDVAMR